MADIGRTVQACQGGFERTKDLFGNRSTPQSLSSVSPPCYIAACSVLIPRILLPLYKWWQLPYFYAGCKMYDLLAGSENMESAYWMGKGKALENFPMLKADGLVGGVVYYDGESISSLA
jgi:hypothetical protein